MKYKNIGSVATIIRAAKSAENPNEKKIYRVEAGETSDFPVKIQAQNMILVEDEVVTKEKTKTKTVK